MMITRRSTSTVEVTNISKHGFWILVDEEELFLPFEEFPWFRSAPLPAIMNVEQPAAGSLCWPLLAVDLGQIHQASGAVSTDVEKQRLTLIGLPLKHDAPSALTVQTWDRAP